MTETYEDYKRDPGLPQDVRAEWLSVDSAEQRYRTEGDRIAGDEDLTELARNRKLVDLHVNQGLALAERKKALRQRVLKLAEAAEKRSWPKVPGTSSLDPQDASTLVAAQNVENALVSDYRELKRRADANKLPFSPDPADYLRDRYKAGLEQGGVSGAATVSGVVQAARRLGVSVEDVVGPLRSQKEYEELGRAGRYASMADSISTVVNPHRSVQRNRRRPGRIDNKRRGWGSSGAILMGGGGPPIIASEPTHTGTKRRGAKAKGKKK